MSYSSNLQLLFSGAVTTATIIYAYLTVQLVKFNKDIRNIQKRQMEPDINVDIRPEERNVNLVYFLIENLGRSTAYDVNINIEPDMEYIKGKNLLDLPIFNIKQDIPPNKQIKFFFTNLMVDTERKIKKPYKIVVDYKNKEEETFRHEVEIDLKILSEVMFPGHTDLGDIRDFLNDINKNIKTLVNKEKKD